MTGVVEWLQGLGYRVSDVEGTTIGIVLDDAGALQAEARRLSGELRARGIEVVRCGSPGVCIDGFFDPAAEVASLALMGVDDAHLADPGALRPVEFSVDVGGERYMVAGRYRPSPARLDVHGALRPRDGHALETLEFIDLVAEHDAGASVQAAAEAAWPR